MFQSLGFNTRWITESWFITKLLPTELLIRGAAGVHEGLSNHGETRINNVGFAEIEHKVRVLYQVDPKPGNTES